jgi:hypothetical protein
MAEQNKEFHTLPKTLDKKELGFYIKEKKVILTKEEQRILNKIKISDALLIAHELD